MSNIVCSIDHCESKSYAKGTCNRHYLQLRNHGTIIKTNRDKRHHIVKDGVALIPLGIDGKDGYAMVDIDDAWVDKYFWFKHKGYVEALVNGHVTNLSRVIMRPSKRFHVDHINHDRLDNRRVNLRVCLQQSNNRNRPVYVTNRTGYKGVKLSPAKTFIASIKLDGKAHYLGTYKKPEEAAIAYNKAARKLHGEYAHLNKVEVDN